MLFSLEGYKALITGGSGSIGRAIAIAMAAQGAEIAIVGTRIDALNETADTVKKQTGKDAVVLQCNLANDEETKRLFQIAEEKLGAIDILVNNAGIDKDKLFMKMTEEDLCDVLNVNLKAAFTLSKAAVMSMSKRKYGRIINMSSVVGFTGNVGQVNYCASKAGLVGMSKAIALEYAKRGITVNCIAPGAVKTPMIDKLSEQAKQAFLNKIPLGEMAEPMDVAYACCFLASKESSYITGQTIHVNGGMLTV
ncbi:MAG: 3-oxoacyl-[acyl-carrier-protein] reductase [Holosporales bacterium]|jgi:3-oxoacyl-[acyl-carrier protein] reductase|nr:3-oxoacyl-[acyl-carrier-protein] reductase [Holosporales bacterium]